jgi:hypothetical protein
MPSYSVNFAGGNLIPAPAGGISNAPLTVSDLDPALSLSKPSTFGLTLSATDKWPTTAALLQHRFPQSAKLTLTLNFDSHADALVGPSAEAYYLKGIREKEIAEIASNLDPNAPRPLQDPTTEWAVILVAKDGNLTDDPNDNRIGAVCQFRNDGMRLTMPGSDDSFTGSLIAANPVYTGASFILQLQIDRTDPNSPALAKAKLSVLDPTFGKITWTEESPWLPYTGFPNDTSPAKPTFHYLGPSVHVNTGYGTASARILSFSITEP